MVKKADVKSIAQFIGGNRPVSLSFVPNIPEESIEITLQEGEKLGLSLAERSLESRLGSAGTGNEGCDYGKNPTDLDATKGVFIEGVAPGSVGEKFAVPKGYVLDSINRHRTKNVIPSTVQEVAGLMRGEPRPVSIVIRPPYMSPVPSNLTRSAIEDKNQRLNLNKTEYMSRMTRSSQVAPAAKP